MRAQSAVEFLTTYAWSFIILAIMVAVVASFLITKSPATYVPPTCYISPEFPCQTIAIINEFRGSLAELVFINNLGTAIQFPTSTNTFEISTVISNKVFGGGCFPTNVPEGATVVCNTIMQNYAPPVGSQEIVEFTINYRVCPKQCPAAVYNTSGSGTLFVSPVLPEALYNGKVVLVGSYTMGTSVVPITPVQLLSSPSTDGNVTLGGITYSSGSYSELVNNAIYTLYAKPAKGKSFISWSTTDISGSGHITIANSVNQSTTVWINGPGTITATFT